MEKSTWIIGAVLVWFCYGSVAVRAAQPLPPAKPLAEESSGPFVEGLDTPRPKPALPDRRARGGFEGTDVTCEVSGAAFVQKDPVSGGLAGSALDDEACGISNPVRLIEVVEDGAKVTLPPSVIVSCDFAQRIADWVHQDVRKAVAAHFDSPLARIGSGPGYQCRRRNNQPDGKLSEHALGKALDISHFELRDGAIISIEEDWADDTAKGRFLRDIHAAACTRFTTVLGPDADPNHRSHIHLDIGCHGSDCTYIICQ